ncbi:MAG: glycosyltransferase family 4 protein, partial [Anaerolineae bacterium]
KVFGGLVGQALGDGLVADAVVIPNGVDVAMFGGAARPFSVNGRPLRLVIAGRIAPEKGIHTVVAAMGKLRQDDALGQMQLTIVGDGPADYRAQLEAQVDELGIRPYVYFAPAVPIEKMPELYAGQDILLLPSEWDEPLSCTMLEAMAAGLMVIGTTTGGSGEALAHEQTGLVFAPGDADGLAQQLRAVMQNRELVPALAAAGQQKVMNEFGIEAVVSRLVDHLQKMLKTRN